METLSSSSDLPYRISSKIRVNKEIGCWEWVGAIMGNGYGSIKIGGKSVRAHREVYSRLVESDIEGADLHHTCENKLCVNPDHLEPLSRRDHFRISNGWVRKGEQWFCKKGHLMEGFNNKENSYGGYTCRKCLNTWRRINER